MTLEAIIESASPRKADNRGTYYITRWNYREMGSHPDSLMVPGDEMRIEVTMEFGGEKHTMEALRLQRVE